MDRKEELNKRLNDALEVAKNLPEPETKEDQEDLDNIKKELEEIDSYIEDIKTSHKK